MLINQKGCRQCPVPSQALKLLRYQCDSNQDVHVTRSIKKTISSQSNMAQPTTTTMSPSQKRFDLISGCVRSAMRRLRLKIWIFSTNLSLD